MSVTTRLRHLTIQSGRGLALAIVVAWLGFNAAHAILPQQQGQAQSAQAMSQAITGHDLKAHLQADESHWRQTMRDYDAMIAFADRIGDQPVYKHLQSFNELEHTASNVLASENAMSVSNDEQL